MPRTNRRNPRHTTLDSSLRLTTELPDAASQATSRASAPPTPPTGSSNELRAGLAALRPELMSRALRFARATAAAEDIVQETMARALRFEAQYQPGTNLRAWVGQILRSVFLTQCRRSRREQRALASLHGDPCGWAHPETPAAMARLSPRPARALASLAGGYQQVVRLVDLEGLSYREAALELDVPVGTVMSRLHRGRRLLAEMLSPASEAAAAAA